LLSFWYETVDPEFDKVLAEFGLGEEEYEEMSIEKMGNLPVSDYRN
jgi:hypothetical protein